MPTIPYKLANGTRVPGVTTVISTSLGWNREALMWWANQEGLAGRNYRDSRQEEADAGTLAHAMVEARIRDVTYLPPDTATPEQIKLATLAFSAWEEWFSHSKIKLLETEIPLISERHRFGGTPDAIGETRGGLAILDWKSSKGIYSEYLIQLAAYEHLWNENRKTHPITGGIHCARFDKSTGGFSHHWWPSEALRSAWDAFLALRRLYDLQREMKALAA